MSLSNAIFVASIILGGAIAFNAVEKNNPAPIPTIPVAAAAPKPQCDAAEDGKCECFDKGGCKCVAGKQCKTAAVAPHEFQGSVDAGNDCVVCWQPQDHPNHDFKCDKCNGHGFVKTVAGWSRCPKCRRGEITPTSEPKFTQPPPGDVAHVPAPPAVKATPIAAPKYTQPQTVAHAHAHKPAATVKEYLTVQPAATHVLRWQPSYGPLGRERGGQWVRVPVNQARQYRAPQPTYRTYRSCANGSCR